MGRGGVRYLLKPAQPDQWISNGKQIYQVHPKKKTATMFPIPPKAQGRNIMDGPLPFLLGMPPNKAIQRYNLKILKQNQDQVTLEVRPKWASDRKNYKLAKVILQKKKYYLPYAVQMFSPGGNQETVYVFTNLSVNPIQPPFPFNKDPFTAPLKGKKIASAVPKVIPLKPKPNQLPILSGHNWKQAKQWLEKRKLKVKFVKGTIANIQKKVNTVEGQFPRPYTVFKEGQTVYLRVHVHPKMHKPADYGVIPDISGLFHKGAKEKLKSAGFDVEFRRGAVAPNSSAVFRVQRQFPAAKDKAVKGSKIVVVLYTKPTVRQTAKNR